MYSFNQAITICLRDKYADFTGRARRSEFWWFILFGVLLTLGANLLDELIFNTASTPNLNTNSANPPISIGLFELAAALALLLPNIAVSVRRLHDLGYSGWWYLAYVAGVSLFFFTAYFSQNVALFLFCLMIYVAFIYIMSQRGTNGDNAFGSDPLATPPTGEQQ